jgi:hypothetical protein
MQTKWDFAGSTDMWSTSAGGHLMKVVNLAGFTVINIHYKLQYLIRDRRKTYLQIKIDCY